MSTCYTYKTIIKYSDNQIKHGLIANSNNYQRDVHMNTGISVKSFVVGCTEKILYLVLYNEETRFGTLRKDKLRHS